MPSIDKESLEGAYYDVRNDNTPTRWALARYEGKDIVLDCTGEDYEEMLSKLDVNSRIYGYLRFQIGDEYSKTFKYVFITWIGAEVKPLAKAAVSGDKAQVKEIFKIFAKEILCTDKHDLDESRVVSSL